MTTPTQLAEVLEAEAALLVNWAHRTDLALAVVMSARATTLRELATRLREEARPIPLPTPSSFVMYPRDERKVCGARVSGRACQLPVGHWRKP